MTAMFDKIRAIGTRAWLRFLSQLNAGIALACAGIVMLNQTNPQLVDKLTASMTPTQQGLASFAFCCLVQFALSRAKKAQ